MKLWNRLFNLQKQLGHFDCIIGRVAMGWAYLPDAPEVKPIVQIHVEGRLVAEVIADQYREDLDDKGIGDGKYGFNCLLPIELFDGKGIKLSANIKGSSEILDGSPHKLNKKLASLHDAFENTRGAIAPPYSDFQVMMLHGLTSICETLAQQNKKLQLISDGAVINSLVETNSPHNSDFVADFCHNTPDLWDIMIFSIIDWNYRIQRPQHLAANMAKMGCRITYVSVHLEPFNESDSKFYIRTKPTENVYEVVLQCSAPVPSVYAGFIEDRHLNEICEGINQLTRTLDIRAPIIMIQYPTWYSVAKSIPGATIIFDCLDNIGGFSTASPEVIEIENELIAAADLVVTSSEYLHDNVKRVRQNEIVRNGAEVDFFSVRPAKINDFGSGYIIGYYGAISEWFDVDLIAYAARKKPEWTFILVGSHDGINVEKLLKLKNIKLFGEIKYRDLPKFLYAFDCCIIPFKINELIKATNPVKVYEYFTAGKPVVATDMPELRLLPEELIEISTSKDDFVNKLEKARHDNVKSSEDRRLWAMNNSWVSRTQTYLSYIDDMFPNVSVVILTYNNLSFTKACLKSIKQHDYYPRVEIIIVDNNSTDGTQEYLRNHEKEENIKVIYNEENLGFSAGNNIGMKSAKGDYIILLNNDTYVTEGWIHDLIRPLILDEKIGMVGPITNMIGNEQKISINYKDMNEMANKAAEFTRARKRKLYVTEGLAFFCVAIRRQLIEKIGYLDEDFGIGFFEDDDYCQRAIKAGYLLMIADGVFIHHHLSASFDNLESDEKKEIMNTNKKKYESKWGEWKPHKYRAEIGFGS